MVFELIMQAQKRWRRLNGAGQLDKLIAGVLFIDGEEQEQKAAWNESIKQRPLQMTPRLPPLIHSFRPYLM